MCRASYLFRHKKGQSPAMRGDATVPLYCKHSLEKRSGAKNRFPLVLMLNHANVSFIFQSPGILESPRPHAREKVYVFFPERAGGFLSHGYLDPGVVEYGANTGATGHSRADWRQGKAPVLDVLCITALKHQPAAGLRKTALVLLTLTVPHGYLQGEFLNR